VRLRFLLGPAGSGKTRTCLEEITRELHRDPLRPDEPLYFLVPEQATFQMERALLEVDPQVTASWRARVVSFTRLAFLALDQVGPATRPVVGELGKLLALYLAVEQVQAELSVFRRVAAAEGFLESLASTLSEVRAYGHDWDALERAAAVLARTGESPLLSAKLRDIARIGRAYQGVLADRFHDPDTTLALATAAVRSSALFCGARLWVDGFSGFTPAEFRLLQALMGAAKEITVALCLEPGELRHTPIDLWNEGSPDALFHPVRATLVRLRQIARAAGVYQITCTYLPEGGASEKPLPRFREAAFLARLERALVADGQSVAGAEAAATLKERDRGSPPCTVIEAATPQGEAEAVAREIRRLVRDEGYRYSDIAVIVRNIERFRDVLEATFTEWEIPFFLDYKPPAYYHPLITLITGALDLVQSGFTTQSLMRCLKSDLVGVARADVDALENDALVRGIDGDAWLDESRWKDSPLAPVRRAAVDPLARFARRAWSLSQQPGGAAAAEYLQALGDLLTDLEAPRRLEAWSREAAQRGASLEAQEHVQVWNGLVDVLAQFDALLGQVRLDFQRFAGSLNAALKRLRLGRVPPRLDQVLVGSIERSRQPDLKCAFLMGMNEGHFPAVPAEDPILTDEERSHLLRAELEMGPTSRERLWHEKYLTYIAFTRASRRLYITYSRAETDGKPLRPSAPVRWLREHFPGVAFASEDLQSAQRLPERLDALPGWIARRVRAAADEGASLSDLNETLAVYQWLAAPRQTATEPARAAREEVLRVDPLAALAYQNVSASLSKATAHRLYGDGPASPTQLETYAACAFRHFAAFGLRLEAPRRPEADPALVGSLIHGALSAFVRRLQAEGRDWGDLDRAESERRADEALAQEIGRRPEYAALRRAADQYVLRRVRATLRAAVWAIGAHCRQGRFRPFAVELRFGPGGPLPPLWVQAGTDEMVAVTGRIDRLDVAEERGVRWLRVIDYKSSQRPFSLGRAVEGLDLQLLLYLAAAAEGLAGHGFHVAGCLYLPVFDPLESVEHPPAAGDEGWRRSLRAEGLIVAEGGVPRLMDSESTGSSMLVPLYFRKDGSLGANSPGAVSAERLDKLIAHAKAVAARFVQEWRTGKTDIAPYLLGNERACTHCPFRSVCQFDPLLAENRYRALRSLTDEELWARVERSAGAAGEPQAEGGEVRVG